MGRKKLNASVLIIPSIDIFFLITMFIFLSGDLLYKSAVSVELPPAAGRQSVSLDCPVVTLTHGGGIFLSGRKVSKEGLFFLLQFTAALEKKKRKEPLLIIRADQNIRHKHLVDIIDMVGKSGFKRISIATEPSE
jgi:biopolymer transport protein ExbD